MEASIPKRDADVTLQRVGQEAILYDRRHGRAHVINSSAARVWELCDGHASIDEIIHAFALGITLLSHRARCLMGTGYCGRVVEYTDAPALA